MPWSSPSISVVTDGSMPRGPLADLRGCGQGFFAVDSLVDQVHGIGTGNRGRCGRRLQHAAGRGVAERSAAVLKIVRADWPTLRVGQWREDRGGAHEGRAEDKDVEAFHADSFEWSKKGSSPICGMTTGIVVVRMESRAGVC